MAHTAAGTVRSRTRNTFLSPPLTKGGVTPKIHLAGKPIRRFTNCQLLACVVFVLFMTACSRDPQPGTPEAAAASERLLRSMSDTLAHSQAFTFDTTERIEVIAASGEKRALHFTRSVAVRRPNALYFELRGEKGEAFHVVAYYQGRSLTLSDKLGGAWAQTTVPDTIDEMLDDVIRQFGLPVPIGDLVSASPRDAIIGSSAQGGLVSWGMIDEVPCAELEYADTVVGVKLWLPRSGPALPRRLEISYKQSPIPLVTQLSFTNWKLDVPVPDATFTFQPPADRHPVLFSDLVSLMVSRTLPPEIQTSTPAASDGKPASGSAAR